MRIELFGRLRFLAYRRRCLLSFAHFKSTKADSLRCYDPYWPRSFINRMLNSDLLIEGRICYTSPNSAFVLNPSDGTRIYICSKSLNRALPNDIVAVKLNSPQYWRVRAFLEGSDDSRFSKPSASAPSIVPAEAEEDFLDESTDDNDPDSLFPSFPSFRLSLERRNSHENSSAEPPFPTVQEVLQTSPSLLSRLFPGAESLDTVKEQKPLSPLPSPHLLRTGRVVGVLGEDSASRRLVGRLVFESDILMPSAFAEAESVDEFRRPQQGIVEGPEGLPVSVPAVNCFFVPEKPNYPRVKMLPSSVPKDLWENPHKAEGIRYLCQIEEWPAMSPYPKGSLCGHIGSPQDIEPATQEILISHGICENDFTEEMLKDLPTTEKDFEIPNYEYLRRKDYRSYCVVSIDPSTAKDLDDALHVKRITKEAYEVAIHIADVSFFVRPLTALDREAAKRTTSTYLVQRVIPMLPAILSEHLCSLNPGADRLAFSVIFKVDCDANILDVWFGRTVIRSCAKLSYEDAMTLLKTPYSRLADLESHIHVQEPFTLGNIKLSITYLDMLAQKMRKRRIDNGALLLDKIQLQFDLTPKDAEASQAASLQSEDDSTSDSDGESSSNSLQSKAGWPRGYSVYQRNRAHHLIEEWMLAANQAVARRLFHNVIRQKHREILLNTNDSTATTATLTAAVGTSLALTGRQAEMEKPRSHKSSSMGTFLRRHPAPKPIKMEELVKITKLAGIEMETTSAGALRKSLDTHIEELRAKGIPEAEVEALSTALSYLTYMRMQMALYFNVEDVVDRAIRKVCWGRSETSNSFDDLPIVSHESWESSLLRFSHHFGLNVPLYTHFTSPIRRYADLLVHRQLSDLLGCGHWCYPGTNSGVSFSLSPHRRPTVQAAWCNRMRRETRRAQEESQQLFFAAWIKSVGSVRENAVVLSLGNNKIQLLIPSCGLILNHQLVKFCREASSWRMSSGCEHTGGESQAPSVTVKWYGKKTKKNGKAHNDAFEASPEIDTNLSILSMCPVRLTCSTRGFYLKAELLPPCSIQSATFSGSESSN